MGVVLVIGASFMYGSSSRTPQELCQNLCGCGGEVEAETHSLLPTKTPTKSTAGQPPSQPPAPEPESP